MNLFFIVLNFL